MVWGTAISCGHNELQLSTYGRNVTRYIRCGFWNTTLPACPSSIPGGIEASRVVFNVHDYHQRNSIERFIAIERHIGGVAGRRRVIGRRVQTRLGALTGFS